MRTRSKLAAGLAAALTLSPSLEGQSTIRDSAGIRIVDNVRAAWPAGRAWSIATPPLVDIGSGEDSLYELSTVMGAVRLSDGSIAVANMGSSNIRVYDPRGRFVRAIGRRGQGPGEFRQVMGLARRPGDTLVVVDSREELEYFTADGRFVRGLRSPSHRDGLVISDFHLFADGSFARTSWPQGHHRTEDRWLDSLVVVHVTPADTMGRIISRHPAIEYTRRPAYPGALPVQYGPAGFIVPDGDGYYVAYGVRYEIRRHRLDGSLERMIRAPWTPVPVRASDREAYRQFLTGLGAEGGGPVDPRLAAQRLRLLEATEFARHLPAYQQLIVDRERNVWVSEARAERFVTQGFARVPSAPTPWRVFDRQGIWLGTVTMPARFRPMDIGREFVLGLWRDADDVEHVRLYRLDRP